MRILKYRVYIKPLKRYAKDYETILYHHQCNMESSWTVNISPDEYYGDEDLTVEQFTGLLDRNGKEIYEGDIVKTNSPDRANFNAGAIVMQQQMYLIINTPTYGDARLSHSEPLGYYCDMECEIIGNIHEPPKDFHPDHLKRMGVELIKGEKK